jgi:hypothetical protein
VIFTQAEAEQCTSIRIAGDFRLLIVIETDAGGEGTLFGSYFNC